MYTQRIAARSSATARVILRSYLPELKPRHYQSSRLMATNQFNFAPAFGEESIVHGSCRPGAAAPENHAYTLISAEEVEKWVEFMKSQGIQRVVSLLDEAEIKDNYSCDMPLIMGKEFNAYTNVNMKAPGAAQQLKEAFDAGAASSEKVVVHCWGGSGRTGLALATWLIHHHNLSPEEAAKVVSDAAAAAQVDRYVDTSKLTKLLA